ncbi:MAG: HlyC/CorC family transporter [Deltaproteobacteria bacterium]|nr:HlyC/CorC family transporter [Deltaproteobacteria bacterium]
MTELGLLPQIILFLLLILASALFSGTETALFSLRRHLLANYRERHPKAVEKLEKILDQPREFISTILVCNNFVNVAASALATQICLSLWGENGVVIATGAVTIILLIGAEITPKTYAATHPDRIALKAARPLHLLINLLKPINRFLSFAVNLLLRLTGSSDHPRRQTLSDEEIKSIILAGRQEGLLRESESYMLANVLDIDKTRAREIMVPRSRIISLPDTAGLREINGIIRKHGHSRYPVYQNDPENIIGILHIKDLFRRRGKGFKLRSILRPAHFFPETATLDDLLEKFRRLRISLGIIVDEYGGIEGILSRDDIVSEIVGRLEDETDRRRPSDIISLNNGSVIVPGTLSMRKISQALPELGLDPELVAYDHPAKLILDQLGRIPISGESVRLKNFVFRVAQMEGNRIVSVQIIPETAHREKAITTKK